MAGKVAVGTLIDSLKSVLLGPFISPQEDSYWCLKRALVSNAIGSSLYATDAEVSIAESLVTSIMRGFPYFFGYILSFVLGVGTIVLFVDLMLSEFFKPRKFLYFETKLTSSSSDLALNMFVMALLMAAVSSMNMGLRKYAIFWSTRVNICLRLHGYAWRADYETRIWETQKKKKIKKEQESVSNRAANKVTALSRTTSSYLGRKYSVAMASVAMGKKNNENMNHITSNTVKQLHQSFGENKTTLKKKSIKTGASSVSSSSRYSTNDQSGKQIILAFITGKWLRRNYRSWLVSSPESIELNTSGSSNAVFNFQFLQEESDSRKDWFSKSTKARIKSLIGLLVHFPSSMFLSDRLLMNATLQTLVYYVCYPLMGDENFRMPNSSKLFRFESLTTIEVILSSYQDAFRFPGLQGWLRFPLMFLYKSVMSPKETMIEKITFVSKNYGKAIFWEVVAAASGKFTRPDSTESMSISISNTEAKVGTRSKQKKKNGKRRRSERQGEQDEDVSVSKKRGLRMTLDGGDPLSGVHAREKQYNLAYFVMIYVLTFIATPMTAAKGIFNLVFYYTFGKGSWLQDVIKRFQKKIESANENLKQQNGTNTEKYRTSRTSFTPEGEGMSTGGQSTGMSSSRSTKQEYLYKSSFHNSLVRFVIALPCVVYLVFNAVFAPLILIEGLALRIMRLGIRITLVIASGTILAIMGLFSALTTFTLYLLAALHKVHIEWSIAHTMDTKSMTVNEMDMLVDLARLVGNEQRNLTVTERDRVWSKAHNAIYDLLNKRNTKYKFLHEDDSDLLDEGDEWDDEKLRERLLAAASIVPEEEYTVPPASMSTKGILSAIKDGFNKETSDDFEADTIYSAVVQGNPALSMDIRQTPGVFAGSVLELTNDEIESLIRDCSYFRDFVSLMSWLRRTYLQTFLLDIKKNGIAHRRAYLQKPLSFGLADLSTGSAGKTMELKPRAFWANDEVSAREQDARGRLVINYQALTVGETLKKNAKEKDETHHISKKSLQFARLSSVVWENAKKGEEFERFLFDGFVATDSPPKRSLFDHGFKTYNVKIIEGRLPSGPWADYVDEDAQKQNPYVPFYQMTALRGAKGKPRCLLPLSAAAKAFEWQGVAQGGEVFFLVPPFESIVTDLRLVVDYAEGGPNERKRRIVEVKPEVKPMKTTISHWNLEDRNSSLPLAPPSNGHSRLSEQ